MKLLHWNIHMWRDATGRDNRAAVQELLVREAPDAVSLVEVDERAGQPITLASIADGLGYSWVFAPAFEYRGAGGFGNALLIRGHIEAVQQWELLAPRVYDGTEQSEQRTVVLARVRTDGSGWWLGSTHLPLGSSAERSRAADRLLDVLRKLKGPWAVCGDFNQPAAEWVPGDIVTVPRDPAPTYPADDPVEAIDYCLASDLVLHASVVPSSASDHHPVVVDVRSLSG